MAEKLDYIRLDDDAAGPCLVIQVSGGGVAERFPRGLPSHVVANRLRHLADRLDLGVEDRAGMETGTARAEKCFADCGDTCQCERYPPAYCKTCTHTVDQCVCQTANRPADCTCNDYPGADEFCTAHKTGTLAETTWRWRCSICNTVNPDDVTHCRQCEYSRMILRDGQKVPRDGYR